MGEGGEVKSPHPNPLQRRGSWEKYWTLIFPFSLSFGEGWGEAK